MSIRLTKRCMLALEISRKVLEKALEKPVLISEAEVDFLGFEEADRSTTRPIARVSVKGKTRCNNAKFQIVCRMFKFDLHEWESIDAELSIEHVGLVSALGRATWKFQVSVDADFSQESTVIVHLFP